MRFRIKYADRIVGLFVLLAAVGLAAAVVLLGVNQRWFSKNHHFVTRFSSGAGVSPGTGIFLKGFQIGKIERIKLNDENKVDAAFLVFDSYYPKAVEGSLLELVTSPIGLGTQLLFHPGRSSVKLAEGSLVPLSDSPEGKSLIDQDLVEIPPKDDTVTRLLANVNPLLENVNKTVVTVNQTLTELNRAITGQATGPLGRIVTGTAGAVEKAGTLVGDVDALVVGVRGQAEALVGKADQLVASLAQVADNVEATTSSIRDPTGLVPKLLDAKGSLKTILDDKNAIYDKLMASLSDVQGTIQNLQSIAGSLNAQIPSIAMTIGETRTAIKQAQDVLEGLKNNPLLKGGVPQRQEQTNLYQSLRAGSFDALP
jgi:phospholipid/cholesterol/gamma-HCH transport system substrate-binding protein